MPQKKAKVLQQQYATMTDEMIQQRWLKLRPQLIRGLVLFCGLASGGYLLSRMMILPDAWNRYVLLGAAFCLTLSGCLLFMTIVSFIFGKTPRQA